MLGLGVIAPRAFAAAATYYVSPNGDNANDGLSMNTAWKTIGKVNLGNFTAGDKVLFEGGQTFAGGLRFSSSSAQGASGSPITIGSYGVGKATISSGGVSGVIVSNTGYITLENLIFTGSGATNNTVDGVLVTNTMEGAPKLHDVTINNLEVSGYGNNGIRVSSSDNTGYDTLVVTNNHVHDNAQGPGTYATAGIHIINTAFTGGQRNYLNVVVRGNKVHDNVGLYNAGVWTGSGIVVAHADNALLEYNEAYRNGAGSSGCICGPVGIFVFDANNATMQFNESHHNARGGDYDGGGFDLDGGVTNSIAQYNYSHDNEGPGYLTWAYSNPGMSTWSTNTIRYNISENDGYGFYIGGTTMRNIRLYNNVAYSTVAEGPILAQYAGDLTGFIANNIFYAGGSNPIAHTVSSSVVVRGNLYHGTQNNVWISEGNVQHGTYAAWRNASGNETLNNATTGIAADPMLSQPGHGGTLGLGVPLTSLQGYTLLTGSPAINAGVDVANMFGVDVGLRDFNGSSIPVEAYDIGAYEMRTINNTAPRASSGGSSRRRDVVTAITKSVTTTSTPVLSMATTTLWIRNLTVGDVGEDVRMLQKLLNQQGFIVSLSGIGSPGRETSYFGLLTRAALAKFQAAHAITPSVGYFGPLTRVAVQALSSSVK
jgi:hypothetical protein